MSTYRRHYFRTCTLIKPFQRKPLKYNHLNHLVFYKEQSYSKFIMRKNPETDIEITEKEREAIRLAFGELVRKYRHKLGIPQDELAFRSGLHRSYIGSVERGERNLSLENIFLLAKALKCSPKDLIPPL